MHNGDMRRVDFTIPVCLLVSLYSISRVQHDLEELRLRCAQLETSLATAEAELQRLREVNQRVQRRAHETVSVYWNVLHNIMEFEHVIT